MTSHYTLAWMKREIASLRDDLNAVEAHLVEAGLPGPVLHVGDRVGDLRRQRDEARRFGEEAARRYNELLESSKRRVLTCAFCGEEYPPGTPPTQHEALTRHVKACLKHPLREECERLRGALAEARRQAIEEAMIEVAGALDELLKSDPQERFPVEARIIGEAVRALRALLAAPPPSAQAESGQGGRGRG